MAKRKIGSKFKAEQAASEGEIFQRNEVEANLTLSKTTFLIGVVLAVMFALFIVYLIVANRLENPGNYIPSLILMPLLIFLAFSAGFWSKKSVGKKGYKYFLISVFIFIIAVLNVLFPKHGILAWSVCIVVAAHYYSPKVTRFAYLSTVLTMLVCIFLSMLLGEWDGNFFNAIGSKIEVNGIMYSESDMDLTLRLAYLAEHPDRWRKVFFFYFFIRAAILTIVYLVVRQLSARTFTLLTKEANEAAVKEKTAGELNLAAGIQANVLPKQFPVTPNGELFALMETAKEVGGDFYDFFYIGEKHLALVIADVSGKGVPAALFMMKAQTLIRSLAVATHKEPGEILTEVNKSLCNGNVINMFVTCWFGVLNYETGELKFANAGHNPPLLMNNEKYEWLKSKVGFVLGGLDFSTYTTNTIQLKKGSKIYLYTDGVTEAHNKANELYSEQRLVNLLNDNKDLNPKRLIPLVREDINTFANGAEQFDDITMLMLEYYKDDVSVVKEKDFKADRSVTEDVINFVDETLTEFKLDQKTINTFKICAEEIYVNIASYAYEGKEGLSTVSISKQEKGIYMVFKDNGVEFNPLAKADPNLLLGAEDRQIGGLGILMVKKMMDNVTYRRENDTNILTIMKATTNAKQ